MVGRKRNPALSEQHLSNGGFLRLASCRYDAFLYLHDSSGRRLRVAQLPQAMLAEAFDEWVTTLLGTWSAEPDQLSPDFIRAAKAFLVDRALHAEDTLNAASNDTVNDASNDTVATAERKSAEDATLKATAEPCIDFDELRRDILAELGDVGPAAAAAAQAAGDWETATASNTSGMFPQKRLRRSIQRFDPACAERGGGGWSQYDISRIGQRHARVHEKSYEEVRAEASELRLLMDSIAKLIKLPDRNINAVMERVAAVVLQQAAYEEVDEASRSEEAQVGDEDAGASGNEADRATSETGDGTHANRADGAVAAGSAEDVATTGAATSDIIITAGGRDCAEPRVTQAVSFRVDCRGSICLVEIRPPHEICFAGLDGQELADGVPPVLALELVQSLETAATSCSASCTIITTNTDAQPIELSFKPATTFEMMQRAHVKLRDRFVLGLEDALSNARDMHPPRAAPAPASASSSGEAAAASAVKLSARVQKGQELRELLRCVSKLHSKHKTKEADELLASAATNSISSEALAKKRAQQLRNELFTFGGLELTRHVLASFLDLSEVKLLLPERVKQARMDAADAKTARLLLEAASSFLHSVLASKGRRSDEDRNAFWASVVSLIPKDAAEKRMIKAAMRLLKVPKRVVKQAMLLRGELEDRSKGWKRITSKGHFDKVDGAIIAEAWHSDLLSTEDNFHKQTYAVYCGSCDGEESYDMHQRRAQHGNDKDALQRFKGSEFETRLRAATITDKRPAGVGGSLKLLRQYKCACIKQRNASECDCKICTLVDVFLRRWHGARHGWRTSWRKAADGSLFRPPPCTCFICSDPERSAAHMQVSG